MKIRKLLNLGPKAAAADPPPVPQAPEGGEAEYANAIAVAIREGLPGGEFARVVNLMSADAVKTAASFELADCIAWFLRDPAAAAILNATPGFEKFATEFHAQARAFYPGIIV